MTDRSREKTGTEVPDPVGVELIVEILKRYIQHSMSVYAAALSFWVMISLVPLLAMVVFGVAIFAEPAAVESFLEELSATIPGETVSRVVDCEVAIVISAEEREFWRSVSRRDRLSDGGSFGPPRWHGRCGAESGSC